MPSPRRLLTGFLTIVGYNWITLLGATLVTFSAGLIALLVALSAVGVAKSAYLGILMFLTLPVIFVAGLVIIPVGVWWQRRRGPAERKTEGEWPVIDLNRRHTRAVAEAVALLTFVNLFIIGVVSYEGVHYTESVAFCGQVCHTVMEPEFTAYQNSPHSRVACVDCHIGPGAPWFVKSKLSGVRQVFAVLFNTHARPINTPVENLRPSMDTCEQCHQPDKFSGDKLRVIPRYAEDEENTLSYNVLLLHLGGGHGQGSGIHSWHINPDKVTQYYPADEDRQEIPYVRVTEGDGTVREYKSGDAEIDEAELRTMDCIDCHNRPTHIFEMPGQALDTRMADGLIDVGIPYIKAAGLHALREAGAEGGNVGQVAGLIRAYYEENAPEALEDHAEGIAEATAVIEAIYARNVFPEMKLTWGSYINNIGHERFPGCTRCHDDSHEDAEGNVIPADCDLCHALLAYEEEEPEILSQLGLE